MLHTHEVTGSSPVVSTKLARWFWYKTIVFFIWNMYNNLIQKIRQIGSYGSEDECSIWVYYWVSILWFMRWSRHKQLDKIPLWRADQHGFTFSAMVSFSSKNLGNHIIMINCSPYHNRPGGKENLKNCVNCPSQAYRGANEKGQKLLTTHIWQECLDIVESIQKTALDKQIYTQRSGRSHTIG